MHRTVRRKPLGVSPGELVNVCVRDIVQVVPEDRCDFGNVPKHIAKLEHDLVTVELVTVPDGFFHEVGNLAGLAGKAQGSDGNPDRRVHVTARGSFGETLVSRHVHR